MKRMLSFAIIGVLCLSTLSILAPQVKADDIVWNTNAIPLPIPLTEHATAVYYGRIYVLGGCSLDGNRRDTAYFANILSDGTVGAWSTTTSLPAVRADFKAVVWNGFIYALGGSTTGGGYTNTVWRAQIQHDGSLGTWKMMTPMLGPVAAHAALVWNGRIYVIGGWDGGWTNEVLFAEINPDGSLGSWNPTSSLPEPRRSLAALVHDGVIYAIGGQYPAMVYQATVYYASVNSDGTVGPWSLTTPIPDGREGAEAVLHNGNIYVIGGSKRAWEGEVYATIFNATVNPDGTVGSWKLETPLPEPITGPAGFVSEGIIYVLGGTGMDVYKDMIYYSSSLAPLITATLNIDPDTLNLKSNGQWITAYIELPEGYSVSEIDVSSILLNGSISVDAEAPTEVGDHDMDSILDLMVKLERASVVEWLGTADYGEDTGKSVEVTLEITGEVAGTPFEGVDTLRVLLKG